MGKFSEIDLDTTIGGAEEEAYLDRQDGFGTRVYHNTFYGNTATGCNYGVYLEPQEQHTVTGERLIAADERLQAQRVIATLDDYIQGCEDMLADPELTARDNTEWQQDLADFKFIQRVIKAALLREWAQS